MTDSGIYIKDVAHLREALGLLGSLIDATHDEVPSPSSGDLRFCLMAV